MNRKSPKIGFNSAIFIILIFDSYNFHFSAILLSLIYRRYKCFALLKNFINFINFTNFIFNTFYNNISLKINYFFPLSDIDTAFLWKRTSHGHRYINRAVLKDCMKYKKTEVPFFPITCLGAKITGKDCKNLLCCRSGGNSIIQVNHACVVIVLFFINLSQLRLICPRRSVIKKTLCHLCYFQEVDAYVPLVNHFYSQKIRQPRTRIRGRH